MTASYTFGASVLSVVEKRTKVNWRQEGGKWTYDEVSEGWFVRITDSSAIFFGGEKPDLKVGDKLEISIRKT